ncbi:hypothetical protein [Kitasatospora sp. GP82]|uniref:hypothetical protein n=1 Tax=Kitasatospora sp. GP82 TaxID=3035089 RepID=UPI00247341AE|nr:hypothetical protein [Kitasatospora sp. GP82]MDH6129789.1 hypothetical protein [Kitasatospora sp. GP82]
MDTLNPLRFRDDLADLLRDHYGPPRDRPLHLKVGSQLAQTLASTLQNGYFEELLTAAIEADRQWCAPVPPDSPTSFSSLVDFTLRRAVQDPEEIPEIRIAWHTLLALHSTLGTGFALFASCMRSAARESGRVAATS